jgi:hypothetical protein
MRRLISYARSHQDDFDIQSLVPVKSIVLGDQQVDIATRPGNGYSDWSLSLPPKRS